MQSIPHPNDAPDEIDYEWPSQAHLVSEIFMFESVDGRTDAGSSPIL